MGCATSAPRLETCGREETGQLPDIHVIQAEDVREEGEEALVDHESSYYTRERKEGMPIGVHGPPDRRLHDRHVNRINRFLKAAAEDPDSLISAVELRRVNGTEERWCRRLRKYPN
ncbi:unnamed protein product [Effrenium voratum]|uniref:Uncharacterized protein n=1 Tax=Effrenium voratum TaxID=2562239 RepID=A0AA36IDL0_9DINO|nr:unnamed protein product [Effrenium voratum]CAJ1415250.1 unnamed protein product [Effrenium voratum]